MNQNAPQTLTLDESDTLLSHLETYPPANYGPLRSIRDTAMALCMLDAGLRVGELVTIARGDLVIRSSVVTNIKVRQEIAKRKTERFVPVSSRLTAVLEMMWLHWWVPHLRPDDQTAFYSMETRQPLTRQHVGRIIREAGRACLRRDIHPHTLRHTFATNLMRTTNIRVVQQLLGHRSISSTQIYTHPDQGDLKKAIDSLPKGK